MASGTVYPAKVALKALLEAHSWPEAAPGITWGSPTEEEDVVLEAVYFGDTEIADTFRILGATRSDESYRLRVVIDVRKWGDDEQSTEQRAWVLHDEILTLLRNNMDLSGAINRITGYVVRQGNPAPSPQMWRATVVIDVQCVGFIHY